MSEEIVIKNGRILTMDETRCAEWVQVSGGKIRRLGTGQTYKEGLSESARIIDAGGRTVLPGFIDSHFHMVITALGADWVNLEGAKNFRSVGKKLKAAQAKNPGKLIIAAKLDWERLEEKRMPDRTVLDRYCKKTPVAIYSADYHLLSLNTYGILYFKAPFTLDGIGLDGNGIPTGVFMGRAGAKLDANIMRSLSDEVIAGSVEKIMPKLFSLGLTTVAAMEGGNMNLDFWEDRDAEFIHRYGSRYPMSMELFYQTMDIPMVLRKGLRRIGGALYVDGTIGARTAALSSEYADCPGAKGFLCIEPEVLKEFAAECYRSELQLSLDAIGDAAIDAALDAFEYAEAVCGKKELRCRIEHAEMITARQMERARRLSVIVSVQPAYEGRWGGSGGMYQQRLGERYLETNPLRELFDRGLVVCGGSDSNVTEPDPLAGIHYAVNHPVEKHRVTLEEALRMYTCNGAFALFREQEIGTLTPGKNADIVMLDCDLENLRSDRIKDAGVVLTMKDGEILYERGKHAEN